MIYLIIQTLNIIIVMNLNDSTVENKLKKKEDEKNITNKNKLDLLEKN